MDWEYWLAVAGNGMLVVLLLMSLPIVWYQEAWRWLRRKSKGRH